MSVDDLAHDPHVLHRASLERIEGADRALDARDYPLSLYLSGLAVECVLQAYALRDHQAHDARHDLTKWLAKCPVSLQDAIRGSPTREAWSELVAIWHNGLRYLSHDGLLGYLRGKRCLVGLKGDNPAKMKWYAGHFLEAARTVHNKGLARWR